MTNFIKKKDIKNDWYLIDASNAIVGRLASIISIIIRGKNKAQFTPSMDHGDFVVVKNIDKLTFDSLLDIMIPESADGKIPSAKEVEFKKYLIETNPSFLKEIGSKLKTLNKLSKDIYKFCENFPRVVDDIETLLSENRIFKQKGKR